MDRIYFQYKRVEHCQKHCSELLGTAAPQITEGVANFVFHGKLSHNNFLLACFLIVSLLFL